MVFAVSNLHNYCTNCQYLIWRHLMKSLEKADTLTTKFKV